MECSTGSCQECRTKIKENPVSRCSICLDQYSKKKRVPVAIPCGHTYCRICVSKMCKGRLITCPICREVTIFAFGQLGKNIALWETLELLNLLEDDDDEEQFADFPNYDTTNFDESETESLDPDVVRPFVKFFMTFLRHYYSAKIEELDLSTRFDRVWQQNLDLATIRQEGLNYWQSFSRTLDMFVDRCDSFTEALSRWRRNAALAVTTDNSNEPFYDYNGVGEMVLSVLEGFDIDQSFIELEHGERDLSSSNNRGISANSSNRGRGRNSYQYIHQNNNGRVLSSSNNRQIAANSSNRGLGRYQNVNPNNDEIVSFNNRGTANPSNHGRGRNSHQNINHNNNGRVLSSSNNRQIAANSSNHGRGRYPNINGYNDEIVSSFDNRGTTNPSNEPSLAQNSVEQPRSNNNMRRNFRGSNRSNNRGNNFYQNSRNRSMFAAVYNRGNRQNGFNSIDNDNNYRNNDNNNAYNSSYSNISR